MKNLILKNVRFFLACVALSLMVVGCSSPSEKFIGKWEKENSKRTITISKNGDNFIVTGYSFGGLEGIFTLTKEGNLFSSKYMSTIAYDKSMDRLIVSSAGTDYWNRAK